MTRTQLNLVLLVAASGLGAAVYFSQEPEKKDPPLTALSSESIEKIRIEHPGSPALVLEKTGGAWQLLEPVKAAVDPIEINGVLNLATLGGKSTLQVADLKLSELGLEPSQYRVVLNDQVLEIGGTEPLSYQRYIRVGEQVVLTEDPPGTALDADYSDLVSKQLLPENAEIQAIRLPGLALSRSADSWSLSPAQEASSDQKQRLVDGWKNARAMWNASQVEPLAAGEAVEIQLKDQTLKFIVAERDPQLVLVRPDLKVRFTLSKALEAELLQLPAEAKPEETAPPADAKPSAS